jgi:SNF2 family DNA or RNA helicase
MEGRYIVYPILKSADGVHPKAAWTVISYDLFRSEPIRAAIARHSFDLIILDEAHYLKTATSQRTEALIGERGLAFDCGSILALTGTPLPNRPRECFTLANALCPDAIDFMTETEFQSRFNPSEVRESSNGGRYLVEKQGRLFELQNRLRVNFMVRRQKRDVLEQLPEIRYDILHVEENADIKKALEAEKLLNIDPNDLDHVSPKLMGPISTIRKMMGVAKAPLAAEYINYVVESGEDKIVVFGWHIEVLNILQEALAKHGVVRVDGSTSALRRQLAVDEFVTGSPKIFLGNLKSVGVGVDGLQHVCNRGIFAENSWTPADNDQGVGRLERIGQKNGILIEFLVAPGSLDEKVLSTSLRKLRAIHSSLDGSI